MLAEKFLLLLETLLSRVVDDKPSTVISIPAAFPNSPQSANVGCNAFASANDQSRRDTLISAHSPY